MIFITIECASHLHLLLLYEADILNECLLTAIKSCKHLFVELLLDAGASVSKVSEIHLFIFNTKIYEHLLVL